MQPTKVHFPSVGGVQRVYEFANSYTASAIMTPYSHGGSEGLWEVYLTYRGLNGEQGHAIVDGKAVPSEDVRTLCDSELADYLREIALLG